MVEEKNKKNFKRHSIVLVLFEVILIVISVILNNLRNTTIEFLPNLSMEKLFLVVFAITILFGIFVSCYLITGLFRYGIVTTSFVKKINYRILMILIFIMMIIGAGSLFLNLYLVGGNLAALTWGSLILSVIGLIILGITSFIGIFLIIDDAKAATL